MKTVCLFFFILGACLPAADSYAGDAFPGLEKILDKTDIKRSGLNKLSDDEIRYLNQMIREYMARGKTDAESGRSSKPNTSQLQSARTTRPNRAAESDRIVSRIDGAFSGWKGNTLFYLKNGQIWQQRNDRILVYNSTDPEVVIKRNILGFYVLYVVGTPFSVGVTRIK